MTVEEAIVRKLRLLPPEKQQQVLAFVQDLEATLPKQPGKLRSPCGLWADLGVDISAEDIDEIRREMWANFPREDI